MKRILFLLALLLALPARGDAPLIWGSSGPQLIQSGALTAKDGSVYPKYYEKNYLAAGASSVGAAASPVWNASGAGITCTTTTTNLPDASVGTALAVTGQSGAAGTEYCFYNFDIDQADGSKVLKLVEDQLPISGYVASDFRLDVYSCTVAWSGTPATTCTSPAGGTRLALSTDNSSGVTALPALAGTLTPPPTYSTPAYASAPHLQARIGLNGASTHQMNFAQVLTGPGTVVQSAVATGWYAATAPVGGWISSGPTNVSTVVNEQRIGSSVFLDYTITATGASATFSNLTLNLPNGYAIDTTAMPVVSNSAAIERLGEGQVFRNGANSGNLFAVSGLGNATQLRVYYEAGTFPDIRTNLTDTAPVSWTNVSNVTYLHLRTKLLPIASMAGQGTVFLGQGVPAYACSTTGTWDANAVAANTVFGQGGCPINGSLTAGRTKVVQLSAPIQALTTPQLQYHIAGTTNIWVDQAASECPNQQYPTFGFGGTILHSGATANSLTVEFNQYCAAGTTYNSTTGASNWSSSLYDAWRVFVGYPGQATGFAAASATAPGLVDTTTQTFAGVKTFQDMPSFRAKRSADQTGPNNGAVTVIFDSKLFDIGTNYNASTGEYTVPVSGTYLFTSSVVLDSVPAGSNALGDLYKNGSQYARYFWELGSSGQGRKTISGSVAVNASAGDVFKIVVSTDLAGATTILSASSSAYFSGVKLN